ncbi:isoamylase early set domain-containing protein [Desulfovibrio mangrovi]|uniref:isoamylase early set domain-containing protein n=1 Tax=Desulfovibrio mangrovi TaxID=2976983 RepID=UPI0022462CA2|nr:isoamylase early set domain-containing protein [Desulfovibrio mangrovi]UZP69027.1 isoamylase early set domain-containing protein [Desulfovibrio mangrovi]
MSLNKQFLKSRPVCKVKFSLNKDEANGCNELFVVGDFNGWNENACPMKKNKDGSFSALVELETGKDYRFRYLSKGQWYNDAEADRYEYCSFAMADNSVISL